MKNVTLILISLFIILTSNAQEILFPKSGEVLYTGDQITIYWKTNGTPHNVWIHLYDANWPSGTTIFIGMMLPDTGEFNWTVSKGLLTQTNLVLHVFDGSSGSSYSGTIPLVVLAGPRPAGSLVPTVASIGVQTSIRKIVSVEWTARTNHIYQVQASTNLIDWATVIEGQPPSTDAAAYFYEDQVLVFFRVLDTTPLRQ